MMKPTLMLRMGQQIALTPQLQQAIRLMQLSAMELSQEVRQAVEANPMLELVEDDDGDEDGVDETDELEDAAPEEDIAEGDAGEDDADPIDEDLGDYDPVDDLDEENADATLENIPDDIPVDVSWDDVYQGAATPASSAPAEDTGFEERNGAAESLTGHLLWQLNLTPMSDRDRLAAIAIIDSIDEDGLLGASIPELVDAVADALPAAERFTDEEMVVVLRLVQRFDPPGVGARDLRECLLLQLEQLPPDTPWLEAAVLVVRDHFDRLARRDFAALGRLCRLPEPDLAAAVEGIRTLNPRPGNAIGDSGIEYVEPDVVVTRKEGRWVVELNGDTAPKVRVNDFYAGFVRAGDKSADNVFLKENLQEAKVFIKNIEYRNETLMLVAAEIVKRQRGFLERGEEAMQPLVLADIAEAVERHESTVSRVTTRKYMSTPRGVFELKYFFSSHVGTASGTGEVSSTAIRALIKKLTAEEDPRKPLSDNKIALLLRDRDVNVARRTVAKYRESLAIPPSSERKRLM